MDTRLPKADPREQRTVTGRKSGKAAQSTVLPPPMSALGVMHLIPHLLPPVTPGEEMRVSGSQYASVLELRRSYVSGLSGMASNRGDLVSTTGIWGC